MKDTGIKASSEMRRALTELVARLGTTEAALRLSVTREAIARVIGGLGVRRGTLEVIDRRLGAELKQPPPATNKRRAATSARASDADRGARRRGMTTPPCPSCSVVHGQYAPCEVP